MTIVFKVSDNVKSKMITYYESVKREKTPPYAIFQAEEDDVVVTLYESGKIMFQGDGAEKEASIWKDQEKKLNNRDIDLEKDDKKKDKKTKEDTTINFDKYNTIGSDEVGTGDYFGPVVVCATYVSVDNVKFLHELNITDSKKMTDDAIKKIVPKILDIIPHSIYILSNEEYNKLDHDTFNLNKIKAILHNKVLSNLVNKNLPYQKVVVDEFCNPFTYYKYISDSPNIVKNITFTPRAESKCLSVACASIIARYVFLSEMDKLSKEVGTELPKGANIVVEDTAKKIVSEHGSDTLTKIAKLNFKNTERILEN